MATDIGATTLGAASEDDSTTLRHKIDMLWDEAEKLYDERGVPPAIRDLLNAAFAKIPISTFPSPPVGHVIEIPSSATIAEVVETLSKNNIMSAPVRNTEMPENASWSDRYLGMVDFPAVVLWVLEQAELAAAALTAGTAAAAGVGAGAVGALGAVALGMTGPAAVAGLTAAAVGAALASGAVAGKQGAGASGTAAADALGAEFYKALLREEPFCSTKVTEITKTFRWAPFLPIQPDDSMLTVLLLLSKFRMRSIPVIQGGRPEVVNLITQSAVVRGLSQCTGFDWFELIASKSIFQLGLPRMAPEELSVIEGNRPVLEAFVKMRKDDIGGLPVVNGGGPKDWRTIGNISVRDVRFLLLQPEVFVRRKELTVIDFLRLASEEQASDRGVDIQPRPLRSPVTCGMNEPLRLVIDKLVRHNIHRIHVVREDDHLVGVVTLRDIISCFVSEPPDYFGDFFGGVVQQN